MAPRFRPKPWTKPRPILSLMPWRATTATFTASCSQSGCMAPPTTGRVIVRCSVMILPGMTPMTGVLAPRAGTRKSAAVTCRAFMLSSPTGATGCRPS
jgi:hypothetical protein